MLHIPTVKIPDLKPENIPLAAHQQKTTLAWEIKKSLKSRIKSAFRSTACVHLKNFILLLVYLLTILFRLALSFYRIISILLTLGTLIFIFVTYNEIIDKTNSVILRLKNYTNSV